MRNFRSSEKVCKELLATVAEKVRERLADSKISMGFLRGKNAFPLRSRSVTPIFLTREACFGSQYSSRRVCESNRSLNYTRHTDPAHTVCLCVCVQGRAWCICSLSTSLRSRGWFSCTPGTVVRADLLSTRGLEDAACGVRQAASDRSFAPEAAHVCWGFGVI